MKEQIEGEPAAFINKSQNVEPKESLSATLSAEFTAAEARRYAESIVETVRESLVVLDADLKILSANRSFYRNFKVIPDETIGTFIYDLGNRQWDIPKLRELLEEVLPEKEAFDAFEVAHNFQDIGHKIMLLNARQIYRKDIGAKMILLAIEDITEHKRLENLLIESEERYRHLFETASDGIVLLDEREGKITHANPAAEKILGYPKKEMIGNSLQEIGVLLDEGDFQTIMQKLNTSGIVNYEAVPIKTKSGQYMYTDIYLVDRASLVQCNIRDITNRRLAEKAMEEALLTKTMLLEAQSETSIDGILVVDSKDRAVLFNKRFGELWTIPQHILDTRDDAKILEHVSMQLKDPIEFGRKVAHLYEHRAEKSREEIELADGRYIDRYSSPLLSARGQYLGRIWFFRDITERKRAEEALRENQRRLTDIVTFLPDATLAIDKEKRIIIWNKAIEQMTGIPAAEMIGKGDYAYTIPFYGEARPQLMDLVFAHNEDVAARYPDITREGDSFTAEFFCSALYNNKGAWVFAKVSPLNDQSGNIIGAIESIRDITERKEAEEKLKDTLESLRNSLRTTIQVLESAVDIRDPYTAGHQIRSADLARAIAREMGLPQEEIDGIRMAGCIHDIGKLSIPAEILSKPTQLTNLEFSLIKEHSLKGYEMLKDVESPWPLAEMVYQHHERMDGSGYPRNLKGDAILMEARILAVADVVESMASHRPYRPALGIDAALEEVEKNGGILYDNTVAGACLRLFREKGFKLRAT